LGELFCLTIRERYLKKFRSRKPKNRLFSVIAQRIKKATGEAS